MIMRLSGADCTRFELPDWDAVAEAADGREAVTQAAKTTPDLAIIDYSLAEVKFVEWRPALRHSLRAGRRPLVP